MWLVCSSDWHISNVPDFDSHYVLCITVWELNSGKFQEIPGSTPGRVLALTRWPNGKVPDYGFRQTFRFAGFFFFCRRLATPRPELVVNLY